MKFGEFIARDAPRYAQLFADRVFESVERLKEFQIQDVLFRK